MAHLHETSNFEFNAKIDIVGWLFVTFATVVTAIAVMAVYVDS